MAGVVGGTNLLRRDTFHQPIRIGVMRLMDLRAAAVQQQGLHPIVRVRRLTHIPQRTGVM